MIEFATKRTEPSHMAAITPLGCRLRAATFSGLAVVGPSQGSKPRDVLIRAEDYPPASGQI